MSNYLNRQGVSFRQEVNIQQRVDLYEVLFQLRHVNYEFAAAGVIHQLGAKFLSASDWFIQNQPQE